jgi:aminoglycoside 6'-N-acetyltransferase I
MTVTVRKMLATDRASWTEMRAALWPEATLAVHARDVDEMLARPDAWGFVAETSDGAPAGFAELAIRPYANGCDSRPVAFLEGIWVKAELRRRGIGARLIAHIGAFLTERGFHQIGSDAPIDNVASQAAHLGWGFCETERVVYFRKSLR